MMPGIIKATLIGMLLLQAVGSQTSFGQLREAQLGYDFESPGFLAIPGPLAYDTGRHRLAMADIARNIVYIFDLTEKSYQTLGEVEAIEGIAGMAFDLTGNLYIISENAPAILKYQLNSDFADTISLADIPSKIPIKPSRIFIDGSSLKYICDPEAGKVFILNPDNTLLREFSNKLSRPYGILARQTGEIMVADEGIDPIRVFSPEGKFLRKLSVPRPATDQVSINAFGLAADSRGWIYTLDLTRLEVIWYDPTGVNQGAWTEPAFFPEDIAIDRYDNIYVSERGSGSVKVYTRNN